mmetsp:Transcript_26429/g.36372  ORF Transcript_26429/g.36372 Transcript_26429/m.36372 type:complete len:108 (-) Transcript_26429:1869-2192(-)
MMMEERKESRGKKWTADEDAKLMEGIEKYGEKSWKHIADMVGTRDQIRCVQRWKRVLMPGVIKGRWSDVEDRLLLCLVSEGKYSNWGKISAQMMGRTSKQCRGGLPF